MCLSLVIGSAVPPSPVYHWSSTAPSRLRQHLIGQQQPFPRLFPAFSPPFSSPSPGPFSPFLFLLLMSCFFLPGLLFTLPSPLLSPCFLPIFPPLLLSPFLLLICFSFSSLSHSSFPLSPLVFLSLLPPLLSSAPFFFFLPPSPLPLSPPLPLFLPISLFSPSPFLVFLFLFFSPFLSPPPRLGPIPFSFPIIPFSSKAHSIRSAIAAPASSRAPSSSAASWLPHCPLLSSSCPGSSLAECCSFPFLATLHHSHKQPADAHLCCTNTHRPSLLHCFLTTALLTNVRSELAALRFSASTQTQPLNCFITPCHS
ncbi:proline-rich protein 36-like [Tympanuchus pallidicinctus]|uniref:proline-rich protein 36-like n=1 Tax=Tympanuchus pallidicinctus TaxID=109042 RepID=UPI0022873259|nr:proline-rich protein 36-like [Tympanuchus pallidicinctus]XP_052558895.1 proline-rich protein 36-like [Tympanuchus pallidicinctus]